LISKKFEKKIVFESSVLAWIWNRIRIRIESIRIHNPAFLILACERPPVYRTFLVLASGEAEKMRLSVDFIFDEKT
jgi:hypothetical protein